MFFIVNAIDLATTDEEQEDVKAMYAQSYNALAFASQDYMGYLVFSIEGKGRRCRFNIRDATI